MVNSKYLELVGLDGEERRKSKQRLLKLDTYGFSYWMEKDFDWNVDYIECKKRNVILSLDEGEIYYNKKFGTIYLIEEYMILVGNYRGTFTKDTLEDLYRYYNKKRQ